MRSVSRMQRVASVWCQVCAAAMALIWIVGCGGCARSGPATAAPAVAETGEETASTPVESSLAEEPASQATVESETAAVIVEPERFVIFISRGPLIVQLRIDIGGQGPRQMAEGLLDEAWRAAGGDADTEPQWTALVAAPKFIEGHWGNEPIKDDGERRRMIERFDQNRDGRVQRGELASLVAQDNYLGRAFSVRSIADDSEDPQQDQSLFALLDDDQDGQLSKAEMTAAPDRLRSRDADDDDVVRLLDFRAPAVPPAARRRNREYRRDQALELRKLELESIYYVLGESTGQRNSLDAASFSLTPGLFAELDADHNGNVDQRELAELLKARADVLVNVHFVPDAAKQPSAEPQPPTLELERLSDDLIAAGAKSYSSSSGLRIELPGLQLALVATDLARPPASDSRAYSNWQVQVRAGQVEDAVFGWLDVNHDDRLKTRELAGAATRLAELDRDGQGHVVATDLPEQLSCNVVRGAAHPRMGAGMSAPAAGPPSSLPAWLKAMDANGDGEISPREFLGTREQFTTLDKNGDGYLDASEAQPPTAAAAP